MRIPVTFHLRTPRPVAAQDGDGLEMRDAIDALNAAGVRFTRQTEHHLKIGPWNYYPSRGTLHRDRENQVTRQVGLDALLARISSPNE